MDTSSLVMRRAATPSMRRDEQPREVKKYPNKGVG
jgi:hypothetical protein